MWSILAILDGACISLPNGSLVECYDELGARYAIPVYCLSYPINIVFGRDNGSTECSTSEDGRDTPADESEPVEPKKGTKGDSSKSQSRKHQRKAIADEGKDMKIRVRISLTSSSDTRLLVNTAETVLSAKKRLYAQVRFYNCWHICLGLILH